MNRLLELQQQLADSVARSDIEAYCKPAGCPDSPWYFDRSHEREYSAFVEKAIEYLTLRNRIARHPDHADWIRVNFDAELVKSVAQDGDEIWIGGDAQGKPIIWTAEKPGCVRYIRAVRENVSSGWQPIDTAPKDKLITVWVTKIKGFENSKGQAWNYAYYDKENRDWRTTVTSDGRYLRTAPEKFVTHWMPLPSVPDSEGGKL